MNILEQAQEVITSIANPEEAEALETTKSALLQEKKKIVEDYIEKNQKYLPSDLSVETFVSDGIRHNITAKAYLFLSNFGIKDHDLVELHEKINQAGTEAELKNLRKELKLDPENPVPIQDSEAPQASSQENNTDVDSSGSGGEENYETVVGAASSITVASSLDKKNFPEEQEPYVQSVLSDAESQIGKPYARGGTSPSGFDCSGLWNWAFKKQGINFQGRFTASLFSKTDADISKDQLRIGDFMYRDRKPGTKKHNPIYHIEMVASEPFQQNGKRYVKTIGSSTDKGVLDAQGERTSKAGVGYRLREITSYRHFGRPPYYLQLAEKGKTGNSNHLIASTGKISPDLEQKLVA